MVSVMHSPERENEQGFMLVGLIVAIFIILLLLGIAAPKVARDLRREREVEAIHRGNQYVQAVRRYYMKNGNQYPATLEQLEKTNNIRYLRQRYADPMTGKPDWRLIKVGEAKTTVKGFFGQPLPGLAPGLGAAASMVSPGISGGTSPGMSSSPNASSSPTFGTPSVGGTSASTGTSPLGGTSDSGVSGATGSTGGIASQSATSFGGGGAPFVGVGSSKSGESITVLNEQTSYQTWEFIYDPRIEQLKAKASLFGGGPATSSGTSLGSPPGTTTGAPTTTTPGSSPNSFTTPSSPSSPSFPSTTPQ
jgi:type II secretory pathway pseudopilin PulG